MATTFPSLTAQNSKLIDLNFLLWFLGLFFKKLLILFPVSSLLTCCTSEKSAKNKT